LEAIANYDDMSASKKCDCAGAGFEDAIAREVGEDAGPGWWVLEQMEVEVSGKRLTGGKGRQMGICILICILLVSERGKVVVFGQADRKRLGKFLL
jgi:hypothetical protein